MPVKFLLAACCALASVNTLAADDDKRCHYQKLVDLPVKMIGNTPVTDGSLDGHDAQIMIDSGSQNSFLTRKGADALQLTLSHSNSTSVGVGGESVTFWAALHDIGLGSRHLKQHVSVKVIDQSSVNYPFTLGADFLFSYDVEIALAEKQVRLFRPVDCADTFLGYWGDNVSSTTLMELSADDSRQFIIVKLNGQKMRAMIDTGASYSIVNQDAAARAGVRPDSPGAHPLGTLVGIGDHAAKSWVGQFDSIDLGDEAIQHTKIVVADMYGAARDDAHSAGIEGFIDRQPDMVLGADFLKSHRVLLALSQRRMYFSYLGGNVFWVGN